MRRQPRPTRFGGFFFGRKNLMNDNETKVAAFKISLLTAAGAVAEITLERWLTIAILVYTLAQLFFLVRDKWWRDPDRVARRNACVQSADLGRVEADE